MSSLRLATGVAAEAVREEVAWPVLGFERAAQELLERVRPLAPGEGLAIEGASGSGRTTLARRLAWTLGAEGRPVGFIEAPAPGTNVGEAVELELASGRERLPCVLDFVVIVDDLERLDAAARSKLRDAVTAGTRIVAVGSKSALGELVRQQGASYEIQPLGLRRDDRRASCCDASMPSLPEGTRDALLDRSRRAAGAASALSCESSLGRVVVSQADVERGLGEALPVDARASVPCVGATLDDVARLLDEGRIDEASDLLERFRVRTRERRAARTSWTRRAPSACRSSKRASRWGATTSERRASVARCGRSARARSRPVGAQLVGDACEALAPRRRIRRGIRRRTSRRSARRERGGGHRACFARSRRDRRRRVSVQRCRSRVRGRRRGARADLEKANRDRPRHR